MKKMYLLVMAALLSVTAFASGDDGRWPKDSKKSNANSVLKYDAERSLLKSRSGENSPYRGVMGKIDEVEPIIKEQPKGILRTDFKRSGTTLYRYGWTTYQSYYKEKALKAVEGEDGYLYIYNPLSMFPTDSWIKAEKGENNTIIVKTPQHIFDEADREGVVHNFFYTRCLPAEDKTTSADPENTDVTFILNEDGSLTQQEADAVLGICDAEGTWYEYGDFDMVIEPVDDDTLTVSPEIEKLAFECEMIFTNSGVYGGSTVYAAIDGSDVYIQGIHPNVPWQWVKGTMDSEGKVLFESNQYLGVDPYTDYHSYFMGGTATLIRDPLYGDEDELALADNIVFDYDADTKTFTTEGAVILNAGKSGLYYSGYYSKPIIREYIYKDIDPAAPVFLDFLPYSTATNYGSISYNLPVFDEDNNFFNPANLYYNILFDGEVYTFGKPIYNGVGEALTDIPWHFSDGWDFYMSGTERHIYFYDPSLKTIGCQMFYKNGDNIRRSAIVTYDIATGEVTTTPDTSGIDTPAETSGTATPVAYFDLSGKAISAPVKGVNIIKMSDGSVKKVVK